METNPRSVPEIVDEASNVLTNLKHKASGELERPQMDNKSVVKPKPGDEN